MQGWNSLKHSVLPFKVPTYEVSDQCGSFPVATHFFQIIIFSPKKHLFLTEWKRRKLLKLSCREDCFFFCQTNFGQSVRYFVTNCRIRIYSLVFEYRRAGAAVGYLWSNTSHVVINRSFFALWVKQWRHFPRISSRDVFNIKWGGFQYLGNKMAICHTENWLHSMF